MPTYEYECGKCGHVFERFQNMSESPLKRCPECRGRVRRLFGPGAGILFKGSGFYQTDYRSDGYKAAVKKEQESAAPAKDGKTKDAKPKTAVKPTAAEVAKTA